MIALDKTSHCGCSMPAGVWSEHGCHWHEHDEPYITFCVESRLRPSWGAKCSDEELRNRLINAKDEAMQKHLKVLLHMREEERSRLRRYLGQAVFLCLCPAYVAASREAQSARRKQEAMETYRTQAGVRPRL